MATQSPSPTVVDVTPPPQKILVVSCHWCGLQTGRKGTTLRCVRLATAEGIEIQSLCPMCLSEFQTFGRMATLDEWAKFYRQMRRRMLTDARTHFVQAWRDLLTATSVRAYLRERRLQYRFRVLREKPRAPGFVR